MAENQLTADLLLGDHDGELTVHAVRGREEVSRPSRFEVDFSGQDVDVDGVVGASVTLRLESGIGGERHLCGAVEELSVVAADPGGGGEHLRYRAAVVPWPYFALCQRRGFRIFQAKSAPEIVRAVCKDVGLEAERFDWGSVGGTYLPREYCVQYGEPEWDFICRLLEDEGVFFAFHHTPDGERMCFADASSGAELLSPGSLDFTFFPQVDASSARAWDVRHQTRLRPSKASVNDYDMLRPTNPLLASAQADEAVSREWYEYPGGYRAPAEGKRRAQARLDELRASRVTVRGRTDALFVEAGRRFKLEGHPTLDGEYFLTAVDFHLRLQEATADGRPLVDEGDCRCEVGFEAIPAAQAFRPARRTPRPRAVGLQSARVTGPSGQEIHCDEHGRVKLQFPWDREGQLDDHSSCWVRAAQAHTTGSIMIPRVGWEVLVELEDGDPDRPLCLGKVWNPFFPPPVDLPAGKTVTGHSSQSSPGGGGVNEVMFDDTAGSETVTINGQHDIAIKAANNKLFNVGHDASHVVGGKRKASVTGNEKIAVKSNQDVSVTGDHSVTVGAMREVKVTGSATEEVAGALSMSVGGMEMVQVGNPAAAVLEVIKQAAVQAAVGAAAAAANRAQAALLGPVLPVLEKARAAVGTAAQFAGPAAALLGGGNPRLDALAQAAGSLSNAAGAASAGDVAAGVVQMIVSDQAVQAAGGGAGAGGSGGAGDAAPAAAEGATSGGSGIWGTVVGGSVKESVGGVAAISSLKGVSFAVGGAATELVGAARVELIRGGKSETTGAAKAETVGVYMVDVKETFSVDAKAIALTIAGGQTQKISGSHSLSAKGPVVVTAPRLSLKGNGTITLTCGPSKVVVTSDGVLVEGAAALTIEGNKIELDEGALGT